MLFRKDMDPRCAYCAKGSRIGEDKVACVKRGVVMPPRPMKLDTDKLREEDFQL